MARFLAATVVLTTVVCASLALPQNPDKEVVQGQPSLVLLPPGPNSNPGNLKWFFPFNFWNMFKPLPWIPLPGLNPPTAAPEGPGNDDKDDDDKDEEGKDEDEDDDADDEDEDEAGDDNDDNADDENADDDEGDE